MGELKRSYDVEELGERADIHFGEVVVFQFAEVAVITDDIGGSGSDGTVHKFIIIWVSSNEVEAVGGIDALYIVGPISRPSC